MSKEIKGGSNKQYYSIFDGKFRTKVAEGSPEALERVNKLGKQVFERSVDSLIGKIENVYFEASDYGKQIKIELDANENGKVPVLSFGVEGKDGREMLKKLPAIDLSQDVRISPYDFTDESGERRSGISIRQGETFDSKINSFFVEVKGEGKDKKVKYINGYPTIDWDSATESQQKIYKIERDDFLVKYAEEHILSKFTGVQKPYSSYEEQEADKDPLAEEFEKITF